MELLIDVIKKHKKNLIPIIITPFMIRFNDYEYITFEQEICKGSYTLDVNTIIQTELTKNFIFIEKDNSLFIEENGINAKISSKKIEDENEYESVFKNKKLDEFTISINQTNYLKKASAFCLNDEIKQPLNFINFSKTHIAATDSYTLLFYGKYDYNSCYIHRDDVKLLKYAKNHKITYFRFNNSDEKKGFGFNIKNDKYTYFNIRIIEWKYPDIFKVIPSGPSMQFVLAKKDLLPVIKSASKINKNINLSFKENFCNVNTINIDSEMSFNLSIKVINENKHKTNINVDANMLLKILKFINDGTILLSIRENNKAIIINNYILLMPMVPFDSKSNNIQIMDGLPFEKIVQNHKKQLIDSFHINTEKDNVIYYHFINIFGINTPMKFYLKRIEGKWTESENSLIGEDVEYINEPDKIKQNRLKNANL